MTQSFTNLEQIFMKNMDELHGRSDEKEGQA